MNGTLQGVATRKSKKNIAIPSESTSSKLIRIFVLIVFIVGSIWFIRNAISLGFDQLAFVIGIITVMNTAIFLIPMAYPYRWMAVGLSFMILFTIYPTPRLLFPLSVFGSDGSVQPQEARTCRDRTGPFCAMFPRFTLMIQSRAKWFRGEIVMTEEIKVTMRDNVHLQTFLFLPRGTGPFPCLMARCMYGADRLQEQAKAWTEKGYAVVLQNVRGRHGSEGGPSGGGDYAEDGYDTMDWIVAQPWCNGRIGTFGRSAVARAEVSTAFLAHPAHRAMAPQVLPYGMGSRLGGAFMFSQIAQWLFWAQSGPELNPYETVDWMPHLFKLPVTSVLDDLGGPVDMYRAAVTDPRTIYGWSMMRPDQFENLRVPNLMVTGWYDHCATGPIDLFMQTMQYASEEPTPTDTLVVAPTETPTLTPTPTDTPTATPTLLPP